MGGGGLGVGQVRLVLTGARERRGVSHLARLFERERSQQYMDRKPVSVKSYANIAIVKYWERHAGAELSFH